MELGKIEELLKKYEEANTSVAEEKLLKSFFAEEEVPQHLESFKTLFGYYGAAKEEELSQDIRLNPKQKKQLLPRRWLSVAAAVVLGIGFYFAYQYQERTAKEEQALAIETYHKTKDALALMAVHLNKGKAQMAYLNEFENTKQKIFKNKK